MLKVTSFEKDFAAEVQMSQDDDPHVLKNSGICKLSLQLQETSNANRIINCRYKMSSIQASNKLIFCYALK
jgi:hypothetical protein